MINNRNCYIVLTAKRESKRFQGKLHNKLCGVSLYSYAINQCYNSKYIDRKFFCSDDFLFSKEDVFFYQEPPFYLDAPIVQTLRYICVIGKFREDDFVIWIDLCNPFIKSCQIEKCIEAAYKYDLDSCFVTKKIRYNVKNNKQQHYHNWSVRLRTVETILKATDEWGYGKRHGHLPIAKDYEISVDYPYDLIMAEALMKNGYR